MDWFIIQDFPGHRTAEEDEEKYIYFDKPLTSLVKTIAMFIGELEFSNIPIDPDSKLSWFPFAFLVLFIFFIVVILMNLLNGLAVSDTGIIREEAEIVCHTTRLDIISLMESVRLGEAFEFLLWSWLPNLQLCQKVYSSCPATRKVGHWLMGASGILLFHR